ncbi:MAG: hypothetical protein ACKOPO_14490, partial [Novosphingobium sp.]
MNRKIIALSLVPLVLAASLAACKQEPAAPPDPALATSGAATLPAAPVASEAPAAAAALTLDGLGDLKFGQPVPRGGSWTERSVQASDECRVLSSPAYPKVYAIAEGGKVRRISVGEGAAVRTVEGIGPGS